MLGISSRFGVHGISGGSSGFLGPLAALCLMFFFKKPFGLLRTSHFQSQGVHLSLCPWDLDWGCPGLHLVVSDWVVISIVMCLEGVCNGNLVLLLPGQADREGFDDFLCVASPCHNPFCMLGVLYVGFW